MDVKDEHILRDWSIGRMDNRVGRKKREGEGESRGNVAECNGWLGNGGGRRVVRLGAVEVLQPRRGGIATAGRGARVWRGQCMMGLETSIVAPRHVLHGRGDYSNIAIKIISIIAIHYRILLHYYVRNNIFIPNIDNFVDMLSHLFSTQTN